MTALQAFTIGMFFGLSIGFLLGAVWASRPD